MMSLAVLVGFAVWVLVIRIAVVSQPAARPHDCPGLTDFDGGY